MAIRSELLSEKGFSILLIATENSFHYQYCRTTKYRIYWKIERHLTGWQFPKNYTYSFSLWSSGAGIKQVSWEHIVIILPMDEENIQGLRY